MFDSFSDTSAYCSDPARYYRISGANGRRNARSTGAYGFAAARAG
jgi:hypothetical protein